MSRPTSSTLPQPDEATAAALALIASALRGLWFGQLVIQIHDGRVVQVDRTEKLRPPVGP